jgi:hypothetical protein
VLTPIANDVTKVTRSPLPHLAALNYERPRSKMGQVRWAWPEIKAALETGHTLKAVWERLRADGIDVAYNRLSEYIGRIRRRESRHSSVVPTSGTAAETAGNGSANTRTVTISNGGAVTWDPAANLRERLGKTTGFDFRGTGRREDLI